VLRVSYTHVASFSRLTLRRCEVSRYQVTVCHPRAPTLRTEKRRNIAPAGASPVQVRPFVWRLQR
jgi:hypothetical protein